MWNEKAETLTDFTYPATKEETWPHFEYSETASPKNGVLIASHVTQLESKIPIFQYYSYNLESNESTLGLTTLNTDDHSKPHSKKQVASGRRPPLC